MHVDLDVLNVLVSEGLHDVKAVFGLVVLHRALEGPEYPAGDHADLGVRDYVDRILETTMGRSPSIKLFR